MTFATDDSHWWDGSQIYGSKEPYVSAVRTGVDGKLRIDPDGLLPAGARGQRRPVRRARQLLGRPGRAPHAVHAGAQRDLRRLKAEYPAWTDDELFDKARLVIAALMAKIHTVEWTPAVVGHPTMEYAMRANWWGLMGERGGPRRSGRISNSEVVSGIMGSPTDHHDVPYSLTEEFVAVYRMHPLLPDEYTFRSADDDRVLAELTFPRSARSRRASAVEELSASECCSTRSASPTRARSRSTTTRASCSTSTDPTAAILDLAATDILRSRERGVPRYNAFRARSGISAARATSTTCTDNAEWARRAARDLRRRRRATSTSWWACTPSRW